MKIYIAKDIVTGMLNPPDKSVTYDNKDYFLKDVISVFKGSPQGQKVIEKINTNLGRISDPLIDKALDKAYLKLEGDIKIMYVFLSLIIITNLAIIFKNS